MTGKAEMVDGMDRARTGGQTGAVPADGTFGLGA